MGAEGMAGGRLKRIVCLSNPHDEQYAARRGEEVEPCLSSPKRRDLFRCLEIATGRPVMVLSSPPRARSRRRGRWLPAVETRFSVHRQFFCPNWDVPKLRVPLSWVFYSWQALRQVRSGDLLIFDNYELVYVLAAYGVRPWRRVAFFLDYEDGKHLIDHGWNRVLSGAAERLGRRLLLGAFLAHPALGQRLPPGLPSLLVPGFLTRRDWLRPTPAEGEEVQVLYSGSLDRTRGVDLLLEALRLLPEGGWHLHVTGDGPLAEQVRGVAAAEGGRGRVTFHGVLPNQAYGELIGRCHAGLNCQRETDPISAVTFPSKMFSYLSAGLRVVSSRAGAVPEICRGACEYYDSESPGSLAEALGRLIRERGRRAVSAEDAALLEGYTLEGTANRVRELFGRVGLI